MNVGCNEILFVCIVVFMAVLFFAIAGPRSSGLSSLPPPSPVIDTLALARCMRARKSRRRKVKPNTGQEQGGTHNV
jgi:hypothetical protein